MSGVGRDVEVEVEGLFEESCLYIVVFDCDGYVKEVHLVASWAE